MLENGVYEAVFHPIYINIYMQNIKGDTIMQSYIYKKNGKEVVNLVFTDTERESIKTKRLLLISLQKELYENGELTRWNKNDTEALYEILEWPLMFADGGTMRDLNLDQVEKVNKMLKKLIPHESFASYFNVYVDDDYCEGDTMTDYEMRKEMDRRRSIAAKTTVVNSHITELFDFT